MTLPPFHPSTPIPRVVNYATVKTNELDRLEKKARAMQADINFSLGINTLNLIILSVLLVRALWA